MNKINRS